MNIIIINTKGTEIRDLYCIKHILDAGKRLKISVNDIIILDVEIETDEYLHLDFKANLEKR